MLLIMGFGAQLTLWPDELVEALAAEGFRVIRYDNRDIGLSHKFDGVKAPGLVKMTLMSKIGLTPRVPYTLADMAADGVGLLDGLGIDRAHIVGASMGGMIAQHVAARYPERCLSFTQIFSTTGNPKLPAAKKEALQALVTRPKSEEEEALVEHGIMLARTIGSPAYPAPEDRLRERTRTSVRRSFYPQGPTRHLSAIVADGDRSAMLRDISVPTLVLHGEDDPLVPCEGGRDTANCIPDAKLTTIPGWGHDLPLELVDRLSSEIAGHARVATGRA
nr:alpha/beta hydrolase [Qipengyuania polymorpha]